MTRKMTYKKREIQERLLELYSADDAHNAAIMIEQLIAQYRQKIDAKPYKMTQKDVILIT